MTRRCAGCDRPMCPQGRIPQAGMAAHGAHGLCRGCYAIERHRRYSRSGVWPHGARTGDCDEIAVERACAGERMPLSVPERREVTAILTRRGYSIFGIAELLGVTPRTVIRYRAQIRGTAA